jgi:hypothetical protein
MKPILLILFLSIALFSFNCKGGKQSSGSNKDSVKNSNAEHSQNNNADKQNKGNEDTSSTPQNGLKNNSVNSTSQDKKVFRFTVSFISKGAGTDYQIRQKYDSFIADYETRNNIKIAISKAPWGREGEIDYCFDMVGLKKDIIDKFIAESRALLNTSDRINIGENTNCRGIIK